MNDIRILLSIIWIACFFMGYLAAAFFNFSFVWILIPLIFLAIAGAIVCLILSHWSE